MKVKIKCPKNMYPSFEIIEWGFNFTAIPKKKNAGTIKAVKIYCP